MPRPWTGGTLALALVTGHVGGSRRHGHGGRRGAQTWWPIVAYRGTATIAVVGVAVAVSRLARGAGEASPLMVGSGAIDVTGTALFLVASAQSSLGVAAVTSSMYPAVAALLARGLLKERLARVHVVGIAIAVAGIVLMSIH